MSFKFAIVCKIKVESTPINHIIRHLIKLGVLLLREPQNKEGN